MPRTLVIIPTYNELGNLPTITARVLDHAPDMHLLVVDDASPDGTGDLADRLAADDERVHVLHRTAKAGLGPAYLAGFAWGLQRDYDVLVEMDADGSHPADRLPALVAAVTTGVEGAAGSEGAVPAGLAIGSRWVPGGSVVDWPRSREALSRGANLYTRLALGLGVRDATAGFRAYRADLLRTIDLDGVHSAGYCFQIDMTLRAADAGARIVELPIEFREREVGVSKMSRDIVAEAMVSVTRWGAARRWRQVRDAFRRS